MYMRFSCFMLHAYQTLGGTPGCVMIIHLLDFQCLDAVVVRLLDACLCLVFLSKLNKIVNPKSTILVMMFCRTKR
jgi:hypothetical protein